MWRAREQWKASRKDAEHLPANYLTDAVKNHVSAREAGFDVTVQLQTDPVAMPVEDVSVEWDENKSKPVTIAAIRIPQQTVDPDGAFAAQCERMSFIRGTRSRSTDLSAG